jgi:1-acyl-sn-glycerol-3-phosphate acyltransferase
VGSDWHYEPLSDVGKSLGESLRDFPREPHMWMYAARSAAALALRGWLRTVQRFTVTGRENLPPDGSFVLVANHTSHWDALCLLSLLPLARLHRAFPAAAADYFFTDLPRSAVSAVLINALPFDRRARGRESLALCRRVLETPGHVLILFPEGTRSADGALAGFKPGIGFLVAGTSIPVVPCHIAGAHESWPRDRALPRPTALSVSVGAARRYAHVPEGKDGALAVAADLRQAVLDLSGSARRASSA